MAFAFAADYRARLLALPALLMRGGAGEEGAAGARKGGRLEFREHRNYVAGDDPRDLDWNLYLRLDQLAIKEYEKADAPEVLVVLDRSASMGPAGSAKDRIAREVAGGLVYAALATGAAAAIAVPGEGGPVFLGRWASARRIDAVLGVLAGLGDPAGPTWLDGLRHLPPASGHGRVAFVVSDFLVDPLPAAAAAALARGAGGGCFVAVVTAEERHPGIPSPGTLSDPETGARLAVPDAASLLDAYAAELAAHEEAVAALARRHGLLVVPADGAQPFEGVVVRALAPERRRR